MAQRKQRFFLSTWNFYLREKMFVKVTLRDAKEDVDEVCIEVQKASDNAGGKPRFLTSTQNIYCFELCPRLWNHSERIS